MTVPFTPDGYRTLIETLIQRGYDIRGYEDAEPGKRHLVLRHDVDYSIQDALVIAEVEARLGVSSTYFLLVGSAFYNLFSADVLKVICELQKLGHIIGLHFDAGVDDVANVEAAIAAQASILSLASRTDINVVSFHRPAPSLLRGPDKLAGLWNAYGRRFMSEMSYCSDSRGTWRFGDPLANQAVREGRALQLLTHPIWWAGAPVSPEQRLAEFLQRKTIEMDRALAANSIVYASTKDPVPAGSHFSSGGPESKR